MLQITDVRKEYKTGDYTQTALDGVSLNLRESEMVAILGPSGSGKSTLLNIIGGLDRYDSGDLIIDGISTKQYTDRDWDSYRNHTVGFVFQSYNLIPHQTVLANVELALTISGVPRSQRRKRAVEALEKVGLGKQLHKKPNQMSGGQMQRVAIARALVNNPSILLADEPTGALDSETSIQVMDLLKEVAKDRLVVMVTHNPELAERYADRIVRVKDGKIVGDSDPYEVDTASMAPPQHKNMGKSSMNLWSALCLSFNNLRCKKGRSLMTAFAGSIGIIGIALIIALSAGFQNYLNEVQNDTLANNPLLLQRETADLVSVMDGAYGQNGASPDAENHTVTEHPMLSNTFEHIGSNDLTSFKQHLESHYEEIGHALNAVQYDYYIRPRIYADTENGYQQVNPACMFQQLTGNDLISAVLDVNAFQEMLDNQQLLDSQYQVLQGRWPESYQELVFVLPSSHTISDHIAYTLAMKDLQGLKELVDAVMSGQTLSSTMEVSQWDFQDLLDLRFQMISLPDTYRYNREFGVWEDMSQDADFMNRVIENGEELKVVGIIAPKEGCSATVLSTGIAYLPSLTEHVIQKAGESEIVQQQLENPQVDVFSGKEFGSIAPPESLDFDDLITIDQDAVNSAFGITINEEALVALMEDYLDDAVSSFQVDTGPAQQDFLQVFRHITQGALTEFIERHADAQGVARIHLSEVEPFVLSYLKTDYVKNEIAGLTARYAVSQESCVNVYGPLIVGLMTSHIAQSAEFTLPVASPAPVDTEETEAPSAETDATEVSPVAETQELSLGSETEAGSEPESDPTEAPDGPSVPESTAGPDEPTVPDITVHPEDLYTELRLADVESLVNEFTQSAVVQAAASVMSTKMMEPQIMEDVLQKVAGFTNVLAQYFRSSFHIDTGKLAGAFHFNMDESELQRLVEAMSSHTRERTADTNLMQLGYADPDNPYYIYLYMVDFDGKEDFMEFLEDYNRSMEESGQEEKVIRFTDMAGMMMSSVKTIIDTVSYALIAFVAVSLLVSSIMIGIITYISVMERTKEIGVLRAMGASRRNIAQVFNAETFIIGTSSGIIGVAISLLLLIPGNMLLRIALQTDGVHAYLPVISAVVLILVSMVLTLLGGLIPARQAAKKDPVIALRSE